MLARRIIPCLDVKDGWVVKGVRFRDHEPMGSATVLAAAYARAGADEIVFYDIAASPEGRTLSYAWVREIARELDIPFTVAGGIRSVAQAVACLEAGADKVSINTPALQNPALIDEIARVAGAQCVVIGVDSRIEAGQYRVQQMTGDPDKAHGAGRLTLDWLAEVADRGAGEVVLNCMDRDGVREGYDIAQLKAARIVLSVPLVASGGAGTAAHFRDVFVDANVSGALAASVFHKGVLTIPDLKRSLIEWGLTIRP